MAWRPYSNLIDGELDNRTPGKVTGWMRFFQNGRNPLRVAFDLTGDFHEDIRGTVIRLSNPKPLDAYPETKGTYMDGFARVQRGATGDITAGLPLGPWSNAIAERLMAQNELVWEEAGLNRKERERRRQWFAERYRSHIAAGDPFHPYVPYPYIEWYAANGRVVLELDPSQVQIVERVPIREKTAGEFLADEEKRIEAFGGSLEALVNSVSRKNREQGGDGNVSGMIVG